MAFRQISYHVPEGQTESVKDLNECKMVLCLAILQDIGIKIKFEKEKIPVPQPLVIKTPDGEKVIHKGELHILKVRY